MCRTPCCLGIGLTHFQVIKNLSAADPPFIKTPRAQQQFVLDIAGSLASLVNSLVLARDEILLSVEGNGTIRRFLFALTSFNPVPSEVSCKALSCLMTLTEDTKELAQTIVHDQVTSIFSRLLKLSKSTDLQAALACGVLHNVFSSLQWCDHSRGLDGACDAILIPRLGDILRQHELNGEPGGDLDGSNPADVLQIALEVVASIATDLQETLERSNKAGVKEEWNGFSDDVPMNDHDGEQGQGDKRDDEDFDDAGQEQEDDDVDIEADMDMVTGADDKDGETSGLDDLPTLKALIQQAVPVLIRISTAPVSSDDAVAVQVHALSALNNLAWTVSCMDFSNGDNAGILISWSPCALAIWSKVIAPILKADTADVSLAALVTSLAWAVARCLQGRTHLEGDEHRRFMALYEASKHLARGGGGADGTARSASASGQDPDDPFQGLGVKCIGVLGRLARDPAPAALNCEVGGFLVGLVAGLPGNETPAADAVEALDQLFDVYGDEGAACDREVFWPEGFLGRLEEALPRVRTVVKAIDRRAAGELRARADEAVLNLGRFIQYKKKNMP